MRPKPSALIVSLIVVVAAEGVSAQSRRQEPVPAGSATIAGVVLDAQTGEPLADVTVVLGEPRSMRAREVKTNSNGAYEFVKIAGGEYSVMAWSPSHVRQCHGATDLFRLRCVYVSVVPDQERSGIDFRLVRGATIRGRVVDRDGRPVARAYVWLAGQVISGRPDVTRSDGSFELTNILGEDVKVAVDAASSPDMPRAPSIYYPGVLDPQEAETVDARPGAMTTGLSIVLPRIASNAITVRVSGGVKADDLVARLISIQPRMTRRIDLLGDSTGTVRGLQQGRYFLSAQAGSPDGRLAGFEVVDLVNDTHDVAMALQPAGRITGRIVARSGGLPPVDGVRVAAAWVDDGIEVDPLVPDHAAVAADGHFSIDGLFGTRALQLMGLSPEWQVHAVMRSRSDITTTGVDVRPDTTVEVTIVLSRR